MDSRRGAIRAVSWQEKSQCESGAARAVATSPKKQTNKRY